MDWLTNVKKWSSFPSLTQEYNMQLLELENNKKILEDSFYKHLEFGTGGMRGELDPGTNCLNRFKNCLFPLTRNRE